LACSNTNSTPCRTRPAVLHSRSSAPFVSQQWLFDPTLIYGWAHRLFRKQRCRCDASWVTTANDACLLVRARLARRPVPSFDSALRRATVAKARWGITMGHNPESGVRQDLPHSGRSKLAQRTLAGEGFLKLTARSSGVNRSRPCQRRFVASRSPRHVEGSVPGRRISSGRSNGSLVVPTGRSRHVRLGPTRRQKRVSPA
jgi:hypothetical protein